MLGVMKRTTECFGAVVEPDQSGPAAGFDPSNAAGRGHRQHIASYAARVGGANGRLTPSLWAAEHAAPDVACELGVDLRTL